MVAKISCHIFLHFLYCLYLISHCPFAKFLSVEIYQFAVWLVVWYLLERSEFVDITLGQTEISRSFSGSQHFLDCPNTLFQLLNVILDGLDFIHFVDLLF